MKPVIVVENLYKKFSRNANAHRSYGLRDLAREVIGRPPDLRLREDEFYAVNDLSFALNEGESLGIIGRNGSGKTTTLKMLNGLIKLDSGKIILEGRIQALIALGAGFNPKLSGRDNIFNAAALIGLSRKETQAIVEEIITFAELDEFIDSPVETYSSGMYARLGFSVSVHLKPEILLIDEILAVGDVAFQNKCFIKMHQMKKEGVTIVLVSHSLTQISQLCERALWMHQGKAKRLGPSKEVIKEYLAFLDEQELKRVQELNRLKDENAQRPQKSRNESIYGGIYDEFNHIENLSVTFRVEEREVDAFHVHDSLTIRYSFDLKHEVKDLNISLSFWRKDGLHFTTISTLNGDLLKHIHEGRVACDVVIPDFNFNPGEYVLVMPIHEGHSYLYRNIVKQFVVLGGKHMTWGLMTPSYEYHVFQDSLTR
ncbi:MAG: ATP-binding cassette domain-containing protein [Candidatus Hydrogenedentes bacterium]|nr:ATP-binding cassette domain-containing protein [Candidatus Hydrogenedentota bacterium]